MLPVSSAAHRFLATVLSVCLVNLGVPYDAIQRNREADAKRTPVSADANNAEAVKKAAPASRMLSESELGQAGMTGANIYFAGSAKWAPQYRGVDLTTGNYSMSATDLSFEGGYGIPVNVTRSYSANNPDEGPFGVGWTLSVDLRTTAGGLLQSPSAPNRSVPISFRDAAVNEVDPRLTVQPVEPVVAVDASGETETMQRDVDGVVTPPPTDQNVVETVYDASGQHVLTQDVLTPEGTKYHYIKAGTITKEGEPARDVLKIKTVTDRHNNTTTYTYTEDEEGVPSIRQAFIKKDGTSYEDLLTEVKMPDERKFTFTWTGNRITSVSGGGRTVLYSYDINGRLDEFTSPAGRTTLYEYGPAAGADGTYLTAVTDPRGLRTEIVHRLSWASHPKYPSLTNDWRVSVDRMFHPDGTRTTFYFEGHPASDEIYNPWTGQPLMPWEERGFVVDCYPVVDGQTTKWYYFHRIIDKSMSSTYEGDDNPQSEDYFTVIYPMAGSGSREVYIDRTTECVIREQTIVSGGLDRHNLRGGSFFGTTIRTDTSYNFLGKPLVSRTREGQPLSWSRDVRTYYGYWGADKQYQQKAVVDWNGRVSFTDYYPMDAAVGSKAQVKKVYATGIDSVQNNQFMVGGAIFTKAMLGEAGWRASIMPGTSAVPAAQFTYDDYGRPSTVAKLSKLDSTAHYVTTSTEYEGVYGLPNQVTEDVGGLNRSTEVLEYTPAGKPVRTVDALNRQFLTEYDADGLVTAVWRLDPNGDEPVVQYEYGTTNGDITNGVPTLVTDGLSMCTQYLAYVGSGPGRGQIQEVQQTGGTDSTLTYTYHPSGDRKTTTLATMNGEWQVRYGDYASAGDETKPSRVFQTLTVRQKQGNVWVPTPEECHYAYDAQGRILAAAFAQDAQPTGTPGTESYYTTSYAPAHRALATYGYDFGGRPTNLTVVEQVLTGSTYLPVGLELLTDSATYELGSTTAQRALKTGATLALPRLSVQSGQSYGYDGETDVLTSATAFGQTETWSYDAAGNRSNAGYTYDALNRMTASPGVLYSNNLAGFRLTKQTVPGGGNPAAPQIYTWDIAGRLASFSPGAGSFTYSYRADGMRIQKVSDMTTARPDDDSGFWDENLAVNKPTTRYYHDGQSTMEEDFVRYEGGTALKTDVTRYVLGARGAEAIAFRPSGQSVYGWKYPLYDLHGNMVATFSRGTGGAFTVGGARLFDAWGNVRAGSPTGAPGQRYCASLGHVQDDESGLVYMRARYYEPGTGRFISEDPARDGRNWFVYCGNDPVQRYDPDGKIGLAAMLNGTADEVYEKFREVQQGAATLQWAEQAIVRSLTTWSRSMSEAFLEAAYGEDFLLLARAGGIQLTGIAGRIGIGIAVEGEQIIVKTYINGIHHFGNLPVPLLK